MKTFIACLISATLMLIILTIIYTFAIKRIKKKCEDRVRDAACRLTTNNFYIKTKSGKTYFGKLHMIFNELLMTRSDYFDYIEVWIDASMMGIKSKEEMLKFELYTNYVSTYTEGEVIFKKENEYENLD